MFPQDDNMYADRAVQLREYVNQCHCSYHSPRFMLVFCYRSEIVAHQAQWAAAQSTKTVNPKELERERKRCVFDAASHTYALPMPPFTLIMVSGKRRSCV